MNGTDDVELDNSTPENAFFPEGSWSIYSLKFWSKL